MSRYLGLIVMVASMIALVGIAGCGTYQPPGEDFWLYLSVIEKL